MTVESKLTRGLEGVVAAETRICFIDGVRGRLLYRGYDIADLAEHSTFEETAYLLLYGALPKREELQRFQRRLESHAEIPPTVEAVLRALPRGTHPMDALRTAVSALGAADCVEQAGPETGEERAIRLIGMLPSIIAAFERLRSGLDLVRSADEPSLAGRYLRLRSGQSPDPADARVLDVLLILHADHELNASTFAARVTASTESDLYSAVTSAIGVLKGPLHGGANQKVMEMLAAIGEEANAAEWVRRAISEKKKIMGFGHRVYRTEDPRATILRRYARELAARRGNDRSLRVTLAVEEAVRKQKNIYPNVDLYSAHCYEALGIPRDLNTALFAMGRVAGWAAHVQEQLSDNRLIRPLGEYRGPLEARYVPLDER